MRLVPSDNDSRAELIQKIESHDFLMRQVPVGISDFSNSWINQKETQITIIEDETHSPCAWVFDRGLQFELDWVRKVWVIFAKANLDHYQILLAAKRWLLNKRARYFRWTLTANVSHRWQELYENLGAVCIDWSKDNQVTYQLSHNDYNLPYKTRTGFVIANPRVEDFNQLNQWFLDPKIQAALSLVQFAKLKVKRLLYKNITSTSTVGPFSVLAVRKEGKLIGFFIDHSWDFKFDYVREFDIALPNLEKVSVKTIPDLYSSIIDRSFRRQAARIITASRAGSSKVGYPRLYKKIGAEDVTQRVLALGQGEFGRRYYAGYKQAFDQSPLGKLFLAYNPYAEKS